MKQIKCFVILILSLLYLKSNAQTNKISKKKFHLGKWAQDTTVGYAEAVMVDNVIYLSGAIGRGNMAEQMQEMYADLGDILKAYGATYHNIVKEVLFTTDIDSVKKFNSIRKSFYKGDFPAATWVQISRLYSANAKVEVELIAHLPINQSKRKRKP